MQHVVGVNEAARFPAGYRILRHSLEAQAALIQIGLASAEEVLLPYKIADGGRTVWQLYQQSRAALPAPL